MFLKGRAKEKKMKKEIQSRKKSQCRAKIRKQY